VIDLRLGDCLDVLRTLPDNSVDSIVTDPPYGLSFMGKRWDYDVPSVEVWAECLRVLKPGGHLLAFAGTRTQHRMAVRIEDAGFEIRDMIAWVYGSGFPKSLDVSKAIDATDASGAQMERRYRFTAWVRSTGLTARQIDEVTGTNMGGHYVTDASQPAIMTREHLDAVRHLIGAVPDWVERECEIRTVESENMKRREILQLRTMTQGGGSSLQIRMGEAREVAANITAPATDAARQWQGWGTALKPALEPITVARKPLIGTVAANVLAWGTGAINVDGGRVGTEKRVPASCRQGRDSGSMSGHMGADSLDNSGMNPNIGRFPANLIHDGSDEVVGLFPEDNSGSAARFFYCAKASKADRDEGCGALPMRTAGEMTDRDEGTDGLNSPRAGAGRGEGARNFHPTVKPTDLMRYLCRLVTQPGGVVLDPFMGSGSTGKGAMAEGFRFIGIERDPDYFKIAEARVASGIPRQPELF
jgi:DNA modification methylase